MILRPAGRCVGGIAGVDRDAAVVPLHQPDVGGGQLVAQLRLHAGDQLVRGRGADILFQRVHAVVPEACKVKALEGGVAGHKPGLLFPAAPALADLLPALPDHRRGVFVLRVQLHPPLGVGDGLFLLSGQILVAVGHAHIPLRPVLPFLPDGLQHRNGPPEGLVPLMAGDALLVVPDDGVVFQRPGQGVGRAVIPPLLRDGVQCLDAAGVLVLVVPLCQLLVKRLGVFRGVGDIIHSGQGLVQLVRLLPVILRFFESHRPRLPAEGVEAGPGQIGTVKEFLGPV